MRFSDIVGSSQLKSTLRINIDSGRIAHAQIFEGRSGFCSLAYALAYAQYLNCKSPVDGDSCGMCNSCLKNSSLEHPDTFFIYPTGVALGKKGKKDDYKSTDFITTWRNMVLTSSPQGCFTESEWYQTSGIGGEKGNSQGSIGRGEADYIMEQMNYSPIDGGFRVFIIWLPERMNNAAANALLKLFEEPADKTIFLFVSEQPSQVLPTIVSRTQSVTIPAMISEDISDYLVSHFDTAPDKAISIAAVVNGDIGEAIRLVNDDNVTNAEQELFTTLTRCCYSANIDGIMEWVEEFIILNKEQQKKFFRESVSIIRSSFMTSIGSKDLAYCYGETRDFVSNFHKVINRNNIEPLITEFERTHKELSQNGNARIVVTHFALSLISKLKIK